MKLYKKLAITTFVGVCFGAAFLYTYTQFTFQIEFLKSNLNQLNAENTQLYTNTTALSDQISQLQEENTKLKANNTVMLNQIDQRRSQLHNNENATVSERLEIGNCTATYDEATSNFRVNINLQNTGSVQATIDYGSIFYNGLPAVAYTTAQPWPPSGQETVDPGTSIVLFLRFPKSAEWRPGMTIQLILQTLAGNQYFKMILLP